MRIKDHVVRCGFSVMLLLALILQGSIGFAGEESKVSQLFYRYDVLKAHTTNLLESSRRARLDGHSTDDRKPLLYLRKDVMDFCFDVRKYVHTQRTGGVTTPAISEARESILAIAYSCEAMEQVLEAEFDVLQGGGSNPNLLQIQGKYEEVWKLADALVTGSRSTSLK